MKIFVYEVDTPEVYSCRKDIVTFMELTQSSVGTTWCYNEVSNVILQLLANLEV